MGKTVKLLAVGVIGTMFVIRGHQFPFPPKAALHSQNWDAPSLTTVQIYVRHEIITCRNVAFDLKKHSLFISAFR